MTGMEVSTWMAISAALAGEGMRKAHVSGSMQRDAQEKAAKKAEQKQKEQMTTTLKLRQEQQRREGLAQEKPVIANPFATESMKKKYTIGGGGSGSGTNY
tara:strand:- start:1394 stop:1693 length:300 start_codon:yes stop_codon:yes gene_type:complete